jgi:TonB-dependent SusC/RagA subfamily outer membrane receptor
MEKGTSNGTITGLDGSFSLSAAPNATLEISYVGYISHEVKAESGRTLEIILRENVEALDEVVVIGYGVQKKSNVTGAISSVKSDELKNKVSANAAASLQGKISGVQIVNNSGAPSASPTIRVRGDSSNGASDPLYVVDGLKVSSIDYLDPGSIESLEVLKDAASAAIYGAEAGNGVILITTKNGGTDGSAQITFDAQLTYSNLARKVDLMNPANNPVADLNFSNTNNKAFGINGMTYANIKPLQGLVFTTRLGYRFLNLTQNRYDVPSWRSIESTAMPNPYLENYQETQRYWQWENFFNYNFTLAGMDFGVMGGMSYSDREVDRIEVSTDALANDAANFRYLDYSTMSANDIVMGYNELKRQIAYYGRLSWSYLGRYNLQANFRADSYDAAYLDLDHNWGYFPSVSGGWTFTEEGFMKDKIDGNSILSFGKLRLSWGKNGSISNLGGYMYASTLNSGPSTSDGYPIAQNAYYMNGKLNTGTYPSQYLANPRLRWEESTQFDAGLDLRFFHGKLNLAFDYYNKITDGLLVESVAPLTTGTSFVYQDGAGNYIEKYHPKVTMLLSHHFSGTWDYGSQRYTNRFVEDYLHRNHGPLAALYAQNHISEGDSPAFLYSLANGLRGHEHPTFGDANHKPVIKIHGASDCTVKAGDRVTLKAEISEKNSLNVTALWSQYAALYEQLNLDMVKFSELASKFPKYSALWWQYEEAGTYDGIIPVSNPNEEEISFIAPAVDKPATIHLILEVTDKGSPALTAFARVIITVVPNNTY